LNKTIKYGKINGITAYEISAIHVRRRNGGRKNEKRRMKMSGSMRGRISTVLEGKGTVGFDYDLSLFAKPSSKYNHELCRLSCNLVTVGYDRITEDPSAEAQSGYPYSQLGLKTALDGMGFAKTEIQPKAARDEESYFFAYRTVKLEDKEYDLFVAAFIGSHKKTWFSNFDPLGGDRVCNGGKGYAGNAESGAIHLGFADAREYVHEKLSVFIKKNRTNKPIKLLVTGHSRGAATAALLSARIIEEGGIGSAVIKADDVFTYCFATPNYADIKKVNVNDRRFKRIFSIVSPEDFVTEVFPAASGFGKHGTVYSIFGRDNVSKKSYAREKAVMTRFFSDYRTSCPYVSYKNGSRTVEKIISVIAGSMADLDIFYNKKLRLCFKECTAYEYFKITLCTFVGGNDSPEDQKNIDRATKLLLGSAVDAIGTSRPLRKLSAFFVFKQGLAGATGGKLGSEYFNDAHISSTYLAYIMSMSENQLVKIK